MVLRPAPGGQRRVHPRQARQARQWQRLGLSGRDVREGGRHVQRIIKTLGRRDQVEAEGLLDQFAVSAARHTRRTVALSAFHKGELAPLHRESIGPDLVFGRLWELTGCGPVLRRMAAGRGFAFDLERAIYASVLHRLMVSGSDRHAEAWTRHCRIPGA